MQDKNEITMVPKKYVSISLNNTNREQFDLFKSKFEALINKAGLNHKPVAYRGAQPYSVVIDSAYADEAVKLANQLPDGLVEISSYEMGEDGLRILNSVEILYPQSNPAMDELDALDAEDEQTPVTTEDDATEEDEDEDSWAESAFNSEEPQTQSVSRSEIQSESQVQSESVAQLESIVQSESVSESQEYSESQPVVYSETPLVESTYHVPEYSDDNSIDELMPSASDILDDLNPTITDIPVVTNPIVTLTVNQHQSNLYTLYGMLGKALANVSASDLTNEIERFKQSGLANNVPEVQNYLNSKHKVNDKINEMQANVDVIKESYNKEFEAWLQSRIEELKAQYAIDHPDMTEQEIENYLASNKPALDELQAQLAKNKDTASQAVVREFSINQDNDGLSDAMRFVLIKDRAKASINAVAEAYKQQDNSLNFESSQPEEPIETPAVPAANVSGGDDDEDAFIAEAIRDEEETSHNDGEPNFEEMTDDELIAYYNAHNKENEIDEEESEPKQVEEPEEEPVEDENKQHINDVFAVERMDAGDDRKADVSDGLDVGVTQPVPVITDEDIEEMSKKMDEDNSEKKLAQRTDEPDVLIDGDSDKDDDKDGDFNFDVVDETDVDFDNVEKELDEDKKGKKAKKSKKLESLDGEENEVKPKSKSKVKNIIGYSVIGLLALGALGFVGMNVFGGGSNKPKTTQTTKSSDQNAAVKKFFADAKKYGIDVDKEITVPINGSNQNVTITALNSDGSITAKQPGSSKNINIPYSVVKQFVDDEKSKTDDETVESSTKTNANADNGIKTKEGSAPFSGESSSSSSSQATNTETSSSSSQN